MLRFRFRDDVEEDDVGLGRGDEGRIPFTVRVGEDVPSFTKLGLESTSSSDGSRSTLDIRPNCSTLGLESLPSTVRDSVQGVSDTSSEESSDGSR